LLKLAQEYGNDIGLYRDAGLAAFNKTPYQAYLFIYRPDHRLG
jgi:hypothetical protein